MKNNKQLLKIISVISLPLIILILGLITWSNSIFKFSSFENTIELNLQSEDLAKVTEARNKILQSSNTLALDDRTVLFEGYSYGGVEEIALTQIGGEVIYTISEVLIDSTNYMSSYAISLLTMFVGVILVSFYFYFRKNKELNLKDFFKIYSAFSLVFALSLVISVGLLSIVSNFHYIREFYIFTLVIVGIIISLVFLTTLNDYKNAERIRIENIIKNILNRIEAVDRIKLLIIIVLFAMFTMAFGTYYLIFVVILIVELLVIVGTLYWLRYYYSLNISYKDIISNFKRPEFKRQLIRRRNKSKLQEIESVVVQSAKPKKKKSKKKEKKRHS